jgi:hypothetical protein
MFERKSLVVARTFVSRHTVPRGAPAASPHVEVAAFSPDCGGLASRATAGAGGGGRRGAGAPTVCTASKKASPSSKS